MLPGKFEKGFADPLSLTALGFLVISLFVGTFVVSNRNLTLDIRERAREIEEETLSTIRKTTPAPTRAPTGAPSGSEEEKRAAKKEEQLEQGLPASTPAPTTAETGPTPTPYCSRFNQEDCLNGCEPTSTGGRCKSATETPTPTPTSTSQIAVATPTPYCSSFNKQDCAFGCEPTTTGGICKTRTLTPTAALPPTPTPTPYCSRFYQEYCAYGCEATSGGGKCTLAPTAAPASPTPADTSSLALKTVGQACTDNAECESRNCQASSGGKYCFPAGTAYSQPVSAPPTPTPSPGIPLTPLQQIALTVAQTGLNLITSFNQTGVAEHVQEQAQAISTDAKVIQEAIAGEDLGADRWVNAGIAAYSALDILSRPLTLGAASLDDVRVAAVNWAQANAEANTRGAPITDPYRLVAAAEAGFKGTALVTSVSGVAGFTPNQAASELFANPTYQRYVGQYTGKAYTAFGQAVQRAESALGFADDAQRLVPSQNVTQNLTQQVSDEGDFFTLESGERLRMLEQIGSSGAQGEAYLAETCTGSRCVVKVFYPDSQGLDQLNTSQIDLLQTHATPGQIAQTNLPTAGFLGQGVDDAGRVGYALEYVPGRTLSQVIEQQEGYLTSSQAEEIVATASRFQQITGQPHGDLIQIDPYLGVRISTGNIIINPQGQAVLIDPLGAAYQPSLSTAQFMQMEMENLQKALNYYISR